MICLANYSHIFLSSQHIVIFSLFIHKKVDLIVFLISWIEIKTEKTNKKKIQNGILFFPLLPFLSIYSDNPETLWEHLDHK